MSQESSPRTGPAMTTTFAVATEWISGGRADLPLPGAGETWERWRTLMEMARRNLPAARIVEAHADAVAICSELDADVAPKLDGSELWGVWAAEPPRPRVVASRTDAGWVLNGTKAWCSAASFATDALLTADADGSPRLFRVDLRQRGAVPEELRWASAGMVSTDTAEVTFHEAPAHVVGEPAGYLERAGFWHGGIGVACCWWGGAQGLVDVLRTRVRKRGSELAEAHLGACLAWDAMITGALRSAAADVDAEPEDLPAARRRAFAVRSLVDRACADVIERFGRALGAAPYATDPDVAQRIADLQVYTRQSHAERDEAALAKFTLEETADA